MQFKNFIRKPIYYLIRLHSRCINRLWRLDTKLAEIKNIYVRRDDWRSYKLSSEQKERIDNFYKQNLGRKIPYWWHRLYSNYTGIFHEDYFPEYLFSTKLEPILNPRDIALPLQNKSFNPACLFDGMENYHIRVAKTFVKDCNGQKWDNEGNPISVDEAIKILENIGEVIIKPTIDTMGARGVRLINIVNGLDQRTGDSLSDVLNNYHQNYIIQERIRNHSSIEKLYPNSVNTIRVITFLTSEGIKYGPLSMRLGVDGRIVDNAGIFIGVDDNGYLSDAGFHKKGIQKIYEHPNTGVIFSRYHIDGIPQILKAAKILHSKLPQLGIISWDLAFDQNANVVVIESNTVSHSLWFPQMVTGKPFFGRFTAEMLTKIKGR